MLLDIGIKAESISRLFLKQVSWQLRKHKIKDLNAIQAVVLLKMGNHEMSVGELEERGIYLGSNPTYNLHALIDNGYLDSFQDIADGRVRILKASVKGKQLYDALFPLFNINTPVAKDFYDWLCGVEKYIGKWSQLPMMEDITHETP